MDAKETMNEILDELRINSIELSDTIIESCIARLEKKKYKLGSDNPNSKLTEDKVREMKDLSRKGYTQRMLAERFDVSKSVVGRIIRGEKWKHVE